MFCRSAKEWNQIANNVKPTGNYLLLDLEPANWYHLRVTAHNNAGFAVAEYEFATLTVDGSTYFEIKLFLLLLFLHFLKVCNVL